MGIKLSFLKNIFPYFCITAVIFISSCSYRPLYLSEDINPNVSISETRNTIEILPDYADLKTAMLFYPGGLVDSHVYNEILSDFAANSSITTIVVKMPANLAVFDIDSGLDVIANYPEFEEWIIAGHSLGGAMAAVSISNNPDVYTGLILMDSRPAESSSLKNWDGAVLSLYSSIEKISDAALMAETLDLLPTATWLTDTERNYPDEESNYTVIHQIDGGSHSFFGTYGPQDGDYTPTVSREVFHAEVIDYMLEFFTENGWM